MVVSPAFEFVAGLLQPQKMVQSPRIPSFCSPSQKADLRPIMMLIVNRLPNTPSTRITLPYGDIHVWCVSLDQVVGRLEPLAQTLSPDERSRANHYCFDRHRDRFIIGRGLLRVLIGDYLDIKPDRLRFCYTPNGKPTLAEICGSRVLCFNLSYSDELVLYAFTYDRQIGVDIERIRSNCEVDQIVARFFTPHEDAVFHQLLSSQKHEAFCRCWTRKEAYLKAIGDGLTRPLNQIEVSLSLAEPARLLRIQGDVGEESRWSLYDLMPTPGYVAALVVER
jgi:4'-phosphopantetheinyl transferase